MNENDERLSYYIAEIINYYRLGIIKKSQAIKDIMHFGFTKKHARNLLEGKWAAINKKYINT